MDYALHLIVLVSIYVVLATSLDLLVGHAGLLSIAHAGFYGVGAYASALATVKLGLPFGAGMVAGMTVAGLASLVLALASSRLHDDYLAVVTFAFHIVLIGVLSNWVGLTRGPMGIPGIPAPAIFGLTIHSRLGFALLAVMVAVAVGVILRQTATSPFGRVLRAIREDEVVLQSLGKNPLPYKVSAFGLAAAMAALAGSLYAHYVTYVDPSSFSVMESILVIAMVIIGGAGTPWGPVLGAAVLVVLPEALRFVGLPLSAAASLRQFAYGSLLVVLLIWRPHGLLGADPALTEKSPP